MLSVKDYVRSDFAQLDLQELVGKPVSVLLGVSQHAEAALKHLGIATVFDLGASWVFGNARAAATAAKNGTASSRFGLVPSDWLQDKPSFSSLEDIGSLPLEKLRGMTHEHAHELEHALDVHSIRDFANWPPHLFARRLVGNAAGGTADPDTINTEALRPRFGEFPTERVYYSTLAMLQTEPEGPLRDIGHTALSVLAAIENQKGPGKLAVGALLEYSQSWYAQGITLGHLLHSLALAPGEATRVAVVDWSRRSRASDTEAVDQQESLDNSMDHGRAISEVQSAVANEMTAGGSTTHSTAKSTSQSTQGASGSGMIMSLFSSDDSSNSTQSATTDSDATSSSWSMGTRSVLGKMSQNVNDRTEQHATGVRNRRASAVSEVADTGHNEVSTRIVANYNHMHALTVQYYEIVQVYRVATQLHRADRCLFVPMELLDFSGPHGADLLQRYRGALLRGALNRRAMELLLDQETAVAFIPDATIRVPMQRPRFVKPGFKPVVKPAARARSSGFLESLFATVDAAKAVPAHQTHGVLGGLEKALQDARSHAKSGRPISWLGIQTALKAAKAHPHAEPRSIAAIQAAVAAAQRNATVSRSVSAVQADVANALDQAQQPFWNEADIARVSSVLGRPIIRPGSHALYLPDDTEVHGVSFEGVHVQSVTLGAIGGKASNTIHVDGQSGEVDAFRAPQLSELASISVTSADSTPASGTMTLHLSHLGRDFNSPSIPISLTSGAGAHKVATFRGEADDRHKELLAHLKANRVHYSQAVFRSLDPSTIVAMLAQYNWNGKPLAEQVEPRPITVSGNYLVLRAPVEDAEGSSVMESGREVSWGDLLFSRGLKFGEADQRLVPIPTAGVYAEAVLGRSNSAEKLDITRFWDWQDSPIPLSPPEIAPVSTEVPSANLEAKPGAMSAPLLTMMQPTVLPAPAGLGAALSAVSNANMFRDMSGLAGTQDLVKSGISGTTTAATEAGQITSANLKTEAQKAVAMAQTTADIAKAIISYASSQNQTPSGKGQNINQGQSMDGRGMPGPDGSTGQGGNEKAGANPGDPGMIMDALGGGGGAGAGEGAAGAGAGEGAAGAAGAGALDAGVLEEGATLAVLA